MKKLVVLLLTVCSVSPLAASKLSHYIDKTNARDRAQQQQEVQQDMNFADFAFRIQNRYVNDQGERCRDYQAVSRSNPYRHGIFTVCDSN